MVHDAAAWKAGGTTHIGCDRLALHNTPYRAVFMKRSWPPRSMKRSTCAAAWLISAGVSAATPW